MGVLEPLVNINPDTPQPQQWAFVNQNFQSIQNALQTGTLKTVITSTDNINANSVTAGTIKTTTIPHNLGYAPIPIVAAVNGAFYRFLPIWLSSINFSGTGVGFGDWAWAETDATNLYIRFYSAASGSFGLFPIKYYLLQETAS